MLHIDCYQKNQFLGESDQQPARNNKYGTVTTQSFMSL
jgi:hypothetical protein